MFIRCLTCGFESSAFVPLGPDYEAQLRAMAGAEGCTVYREEVAVEMLSDVIIVPSRFMIFCPRGHQASLLPTPMRWLPMRRAS